MENQKRYRNDPVLLIIIMLLYVTACSTSQIAPEKKDPLDLYGELFHRVQTAPVFEDSKYFVDMVPRFKTEMIMSDFKSQNPKTKDELKTFVETHFQPSTELLPSFTSGPHVSVEDHIKRLWGVLKRKPHREARSESSLLSLPYSYVVPGGRFREIYYWDSYFTQLGLWIDEEDAVFQDMIRNFSYLIDKYDRIPNGNRNYYLGRSQPPFFSHMVGLWQAKFGIQSAQQFLPQLKKEHAFWMSEPRVVSLKEGLLNRYGDDRTAPRPEAYKEDMALAEEAHKRLGRSKDDVFRDLRAGAESGWDFGSRWFKDPTDFASIETTSFIPIDLNSLLYHLEIKIAELSAAAGNSQDATEFKQRAENRKRMIVKYMWDESSGTFRDYNWRLESRSERSTVAMVVPLFVGLAEFDQAKRLSQVIERDFLKAGGLVTSLHTTGQQWDAPNGWAPHQWMAYVGLKRYGQNQVAEKIRSRWLALNTRVFKTTGKMMEKYNVVNIELKSGGGEYPLQDGFGWTNGVFLALLNSNIVAQRLGLWQ